MKELKDISSISANFDIKAETLAATLLGEADGSLKDFTLDQILMRPKGAERRRIANDVHWVKPRYFDFDDVIQIEINRKGFYDILPEGLFLRLEERYKDAKERTKAIDQQIKEARKFFLPFEQALYQPRIEGEIIAQKYSEDFPEFIAEIWGLDRFKNIIDDRQEYLLCHLIPEARRVVGNWKLTQLIFETVLKKEVKLFFTQPIEIDCPDSEASSGGLTIGGNSILGSTFKDDIPVLNIEVENVSKDEVEDYLEEGKKMKLIKEILCSYFVPLEVKVEIKVHISEESMEFALGKSFLGYNVKLDPVSEAL